MSLRKLASGKAFPPETLDMILIVKLQFLIHSYPNELFSDDSLYRQKEQSVHSWKDIPDFFNKIFL